MERAFIRTNHHPPAGTTRPETAVGNVPTHALSGSPGWSQSALSSPPDRKARRLLFQAPIADTLKWRGMRQ